MEKNTFWKMQIHTFQTKHIMLNVNNHFASNNENNTRYNTQACPRENNKNVNDQTFIPNQFRNLRDSN